MSDQAQPRTEQVLALTKTLMQARSITPDDAGCQTLMGEYLTNLGFEIEHLDAGPVSNLWATRCYGPGPHVIFAGHTDVVPPGPLQAWASDPFEPSIRNGLLYGRGAADMKSSLAAMLVALKNFHGETGTVSLLITSDEEGDAIEGTKYAVAELAARGVKPDYCIVGEPSSNEVLGDVVRCGRRGSLNGRLSVKGVQGHVAYPEDVVNPIHKVMPALTELSTHSWDQGNDFFPPTSFQISNINAGTGATNVVPGELEVLFNFRYNTNHTAAELKAFVDATLFKWALNYSCKWHLSGEPFLTKKGVLTDATSQAVRQITGGETQLSTGGGTSDGRFIAPWSQEHQVQVVELGPRNATIHKVDECTPIAELGPLSQIYTAVLEILLH